MNKYDLTKLLRSNKSIDKIQFLKKICRGKKVLDLGCIRHNAEFSITDKNWLHGKLKAVAKYIVGVDYLFDEVKKIKSMGFNVIYGDVTKPLNLSEKFDVIVAGDLIEHLVNFEAFFDNCSNYLEDKGVLIITTPNPFYSSQYHYILFKQNYLVNEEHTCWIDPMTMNQLSLRMGFEIKNIFFIKDSWKLQWIISESENDQYSIVNNKWTKSSLGHKVVRKIMGIVFSIFYIPFSFLTGSKSYLTSHTDYLVVLKKKF